MEKLVEAAGEKLFARHAPEFQRGIVRVEHFAPTQVGDPLRHMTGLAEHDVGEFYALGEETGCSEMGILRNRVCQAKLGQLFSRVCSCPLSAVTPDCDADHWLIFPIR